MIAVLHEESNFRWIEFDVAEHLPKDWIRQVTTFATSNLVTKIIIPTSVTSREANSKLSIRCEVVGGRKIRTGLPWLYKMYADLFLSCAQQFIQEPVTTARDERYAININVQHGRHMRYECHVDSNPVEGLLYVTTHSPGEGGELVVSLRQDAKGPEEISCDCVRIFPQAGKLIFFDARIHPHYVSSLASDADIRVVVAMNYYTPSCTEDERPRDLNHHLGLE